MDANQKRLINQIKAVCFACVDLNLYLDTHPEDKKALNDFNILSNELIKLERMHESTYGPLLNFGLARLNAPGAWIKGPWPWENEAN